MTSSTGRARSVKRGTKARSGSGRQRKLLTVVPHAGGKPTYEFKTSRKFTVEDKVSKYGLTVAQYHQMMVDQDDKCYICGKKPYGKTLAIDHDHKTGRVRGLLCRSCNLAVGKFFEKPGRHQIIMDYLDSEHDYRNT